MSAISAPRTPFLLTPLREGRPGTAEMTYECVVFLLTPLREGRPLRCDVRRARMLISTHAPAGGAPMVRRRNSVEYPRISTHAPAGGATVPACVTPSASIKFLLTPLREGRHIPASTDCSAVIYFYSRPCGRGDKGRIIWQQKTTYFYSRPCGRGDQPTGAHDAYNKGISTHAPAGGATAIFHKSVMRFCGKLPKDDTVLCLASFGFPGRDPKAVYLAWISCANLPQKCVREGLALKDQGTSCFHEGLASHAFDPVLV